MNFGDINRVRIQALNDSGKWKHFKFNIGDNPPKDKATKISNKEFLKLKDDGAQVLQPLYCE